MLEKERFLAIKKLARDVRKENKEVFKKIEKKPIDEAVEEKNKFVSSLLKDMSEAFSSGEQGKEEKQIFRANLLIPDDDEFYDSYSNNKNIRNLMNKYAVNIEDVMSKITELNIYGKYIEDKSDFVDEMVKISPKQAEDLLDEIDDLSNTLTNLDLSKIKLEKTKLEIPDDSINDSASFISKDIKKEIVEDSDTSFISDVNKKELDEIDYHDNLEHDDILDESFDSINRAISGFVTDYNSIRDSLRDREDEISDLKEKVRKLNSENEKISEDNNNLHTRQSEYREENNDLKAENSKLSATVKRLNMENEKINTRMKLLEDKLIKTASLLNKVYNGIHKG